MPNPFADVMRKKRSEELVAIVTTERDDYQAEALSAAERELARRKIAPKRIAKVQERVEVAAVEQRSRADEPLTGDEKLACVFVPFVWNLLRARRWKKEGYARKAVETERWALYGLLVYFVVVIATGYMIKTST